MSKLNPQTEIIPICGRVTEENISEFIGEAQIVSDGLDNFSTRLVVNSSCVRHRIPFIHGSVSRFRGLVTTIIPGETARFGCLYPGKSPGGEGLGVLGVIPAVVANIQALEAIKLIIGHGPSLAGKLLQFNGNDMKFRIYEIQRNEECNVCLSLNI